MNKIVTTELRVSNESIQQISQSQLTEVRSRESQPMMDTENRYFIGKDYSNLYRKKMEAVEKYYQGISYFYRSNFSNSTILNRLH